MKGMVTPMRQSARDLVMRTRVPKPGDDWFRIENHADGGDTTKVYIYDEIGYWGTSADDFVKEFAAISTPNIHVHINSPGGQVFDGVAIYNAINNHPSKITTICDALAASAASFIFQAGDERQVTRNATMMIHDASGLAYGNAKDLQDMADLLNKLSGNIAGMYAYHAGGTADEWRAFMQEETWYTAQEAVDAGLADTVLATEDKQAEQATNKWNLSVYNYKGRAEAPAPDEIRTRVASIINRAKEAHVTKPAPTNTETQPTDPPVPDPAADPAAPAAEPEEETAPPAGDPAVPPAPQADPQNKGGVPVLVNGVPTTDPAAIQKHIQTLESFRDDTRDTNRKNFVQKLASDKKIAASQISELEGFALDLSDAQYEKWVASWNAAPALSLFASTTGGVSNPDGNTSDADKLRDQLEIAEETLKQLKNSGMTQEQLEKTPSWAKAQELKQKLQSA